MKRFAAVIVQSVSALFIETATAVSFTGGQQQFLTSFREHGLISQQQYQEALEASNGSYSLDVAVNPDTETLQKCAAPEVTKPPMPPSNRTTESVRPDYTVSVSH